MYVFDLEKIRQQLHQARPVLAEIGLYNTTPALVGSWKATGYTSLHHPEPPRPTDIAGKTRWWLRSILAAGFYELEGIHLTHHAADILAAEIMGSTAEASKIILAVDPTPMSERIKCTIPGCSTENPSNIRKKLVSDPDNARSALHKCSTSRLREPQCLDAALLSRRILLQMLGKNPEEIMELTPFPPGFYEFNLVVSERPNAWTSHGIREKALRVAGRALGMALFFTGIGRMTTRGYGKLAPTNIDKLEEQANKNPLAETLWETYNLLASSNVKELAAKTTSDAQAYLHCLTAHKRRTYQKALDYATNPRGSARYAAEIVSIAESINERVSIIPILHPDYIVHRSVNSADIKLKTIISREKIVELLRCGCLPKRERSWCIVAAISEAVSKTALKYIATRAVSGTGIAIPGYILGLPRGSIYVGIKTDEKESIRRHPSLVHFALIDNYLHIIAFREYLYILPKEDYGKNICMIYYTCKDAKKISYISFQKCYNYVDSVLGGESWNSGKSVCMSKILSKILERKNKLHNNSIIVSFDKYWIHNNNLFIINIDNIISALISFLVE